jgi:uncharacterized protein (DUF58 family)
LLRNWALRRQGPDALPLRLKPGRIYILPTRLGWTFGGLVAVTFIAGMNYGNGLAMLFSFWLAGFALVATVQTQRGLAGAVVESATATPAFAGNVVQLQLRMAGRAPPEDLQLSGDTTEAGTPAPDTPATGLVRTRLPARRRGIWRAPALLLSTSAPFGLFRTWTWLSLDVKTLVYPAPIGMLPVPEITGDEAGASRVAQGQDELAWLRDFREGDSPRQVAWKAWARGAPLLVREYQSTGNVQRDFDYSALSGLGMEERLSQLTRWVVDASASGEHWVLRLPDAPPLSGGGKDHLATCLHRLAVFGLAEPDRP